MNDTLSILRQFLRFMHLRGECSPALALAVPTAADFGHQRAPAVLDDGQRRKLLGAFDRKSGQGQRDYAIAVCLMDLGLRAIEVSRLRVDAIDWRRKSLSVPAAKASPGRQLPLPPYVASALRNYLRHRPPTDAAQLFVGQTLLRGRPLTSWAIASAMNRAYRRCGFVGWYGTHRLRHSSPRGSMRMARPPRRSPICSDTGSWPRPIIILRPTTFDRSLNHGLCSPIIQTNLGKPVPCVSAQPRLSDALSRVAFRFCPLRRSWGSGKAFDHGPGDAVGHRRVGSPKNARRKALHGARIRQILRVVGFTNADSGPLFARAQLSASSPASLQPGRG